MYEEKLKKELNKCPNCKANLAGFDMIDNLQRCLRCRKLVDKYAEEIEGRLKKRIYGSISSFEFFSDKKFLIFFTNSCKNPNFYLYNLESDEICWAKRVSENNISRFIYIENRVIFEQRNKFPSLGYTLECHDATSGTFITRFDVKEVIWIRIIKSRNRLIIGCKDGFLYLFDKEINLINKVSLRGPGMEWKSAYSAPTPYNAVINKNEELLAFSWQLTLFLFDCELNFIWTRDVTTGLYQFNLRFPFNKNSKFQQKIYGSAFKTLEINPGVSKEEIKTAFRRKALQWHPDRHVEEDKEMAEEKFKEIVNAYELLTEASEEEINNELSEIGGMNFVASISVYQRICAVEFLKEENTKEEYIRILTTRGVEEIFNIRGQAITSDKDRLKFLK